MAASIEAWFRVRVGVGAMVMVTITVAVMVTITVAVICTIRLITTVTVADAAYDTKMAIYSEALTLTPIGPKCTPNTLTIRTIAL